MQKLGNLTDVIEKIAHHLHGDNQTLSNLIQVDTKLYKNRLILIREMVLNRKQSIKAYEKKPFGWNYVHTLDLSSCRNITTDLSTLTGVKKLTLPNGHVVIKN